MTPPAPIASEVLGIVRTIDDLQAIMRARAEQLGVTRQSIGQAAMLPMRYANKVLAPRPTKRLGALSIAGIMEALQFELVAVPRTDVPKRITDKLEKIEVLNPMLSTTVHFQIGWREMRKRARKGGKNSRKYMSKRKAKALAQKAANARWYKPQADRASTSALRLGVSSAPSFCADGPPKGKARRDRTALPAQARQAPKVIPRRAAHP